MRKNIFNTVAGLLVAVSMLFAAIGCTNINDPDTLKNDSFTVNKMAIAGFKVIGLEGSYDHATVQLKSGDTVIAEGIIADDDDDLTPGSAFVKLETPYIFDAGENSPKDFECYLEVVKSGVKLADIKAVDPEDLTAVANAKLPIIPSPYGTKDADLAKRYVDVQVSNGVGTFSFAEELSASLRFAYTALPLMTWDDVLAADSAKTWAKIESKAKADAEYATYKIIVNNLEDDEDGMRYVVTGASIGSKKEVAGDHWNAWADNNADEGLISEVKDGTVEFNFIGKAPDWNSGKVAIKIAAIDDPMKSDPWLCLLAGPIGGDGKPGNFNLPADKDYTITIDAKVANAEYKFSAVNERFVKVVNFTVEGTQLKEIKEAGESEYLAFCEAWLPKNEWGAKTPNKVEIDKIVIDGEVGSATLSLGNGVDFWAGEPYTFVDMPMQIVFPESDDDFWTNKLMEAGFKVYFDDDWIGKAVNITYNMDTEEVTIESGAYILIEDIQLVNYTGAATEVFFLEGWVPDNEWGATTPNKASVVSGSATCTLSSPAKIIDEKFGIQIVNLKEDATEFGEGWANVDKIQDGSLKVDNPLDLETYTLKFDCSTSALTLVKK